MLQDDLRGLRPGDWLVAGWSVRNREFGGRRAVLRGSTLASSGRSPYCLQKKVVFWRHVPPDGRWITFQDLGPPRRERIAPFAGETLAPEGAWHSVLAELAQWSPNGTLVYGVSDHDGFSCIWAQRVDPATKRPVGSPLPIFHAHGARMTVYTRVAIGRARAVLTLTERTGNIWMAEWKGGR